MKTRREFLFDGCATVMGLALLPAAAASAAGISHPVSSAAGSLSYEDLARQVNTSFRARTSSSSTVELTLLKAPLAVAVPARPGRKLRGDAGNERFSLVFSGPKTPLLESAIHRLEHEELGQVELYLGRVGTLAREDVRYEAVFNRPVPRSSPVMKSAPNQTT